MSRSYFRNNLGPAILWGVFHLFFLHWSPNILGGLFALRGLLVFVFLLLRHEPTKRAPLYQILISWFSTLLPTQLSWASHGTTSETLGVGLIIVGALVVGISIIDLGRSFGISPAVRPKVSGGIYRYLSNPMYWGHVIGEIGTLIVSPNSWNLSLIVAGWSLYFLRAKWEKEIYIRESSARWSHDLLVNGLETNKPVLK